MRKDTNNPDNREQEKMSRRQLFSVKTGGKSTNSRERYERDAYGDDAYESADSGKERTGSILKRGLGIIGVLLLFAAVVIVFNVLFVSRYNSYEVIENTGVQNAAVSDYVPYQNSLLKYSKDGAVYVDEKGEVVWNETFAMKMPQADVSGEYIAIADLSGNDVYIFNKEGKVANTTMPYQICDIAVASQGEFAVILKADKANYINIYDKNGEQISERQTTIDKSGYPMDIDLSEDGEKLFSAYLSIDGVEAKYSLSAYNFGVAGQNENADRLMGGYQLDDTVVSKVEFLDNNTICAFGDNQIIIYAMKQKPSKKAEIPLEKEVKSVAFNADYIGVVVPNDDEKREDSPYKLELYNTNGRKVMGKDIDFDYDNIQIIGNEIILTGGTECRIYTTDGKQKFSGSFQKNVMDLIPTGYSRRYIVLYDSGSEVVRLTHESQGKQ